MILDVLKNNISKYNISKDELDELQSRDMIVDIIKSKLLYQPIDLGLIHDTLNQISKILNIYIDYCNIAIDFVDNIIYIKGIKYISVLAFIPITFERFGVSKRILDIDDCKSLSKWKLYVDKNYIGDLTYLNITEDPIGFNINSDDILRVGYNCKFEVIEGMEEYFDEYYEQ